MPLRRQFDIGLCDPCKIRHELRNVDPRIDHGGEPRDFGVAPELDGTHLNHPIIPRIYSGRLEVEGNQSFVSRVRQMRMLPL